MRYVNSTRSAFGGVSPGKARDRPVREEAKLGQRSLLALIAGDGNPQQHLAPSNIEARLRTCPEGLVAYARHALHRGLLVLAGLFALDFGGHAQPVRELRCPRAPNHLERDRL